MRKRFLSWIDVRPLPAGVLDDRSTVVSLR